jgi:hypothetical protein
MPRGSFTQVSARMLAGLPVALAVVAAVAADAPVVQAPDAPILLPAPELGAPPELPAAPQKPQDPASASMQAGIPGCAVWTDRCVICQRDGGIIACSNIGTACQPQAMLCLRAEAAEEKKPAN